MAQHGQNALAVPYIHCYLHGLTSLYLPYERQSNHFACLHSAVSLSCGQAIDKMGGMRAVWRGEGASSVVSPGIMAGLGAIRWQRKCHEFFKQRLLSEMLVLILKCILSKCYPNLSYLSHDHGNSLLLLYTDLMYYRFSHMS